MQRFRYSRLVPALLILPALGAWMGGWAVTTVDELPDHVETGKPFTLSYKVRQHGVKLTSNLEGQVEARLGDRLVTARAAPAAHGGYAASITLPESGNWSIVIRNGFGDVKTKPFFLGAVVPGAPAAPLAEPVRGERLFVAKGCITCHVDIDVGPKLSGRRFESQYLAQFLADPKPTANLKPNQSPMPNLGLRTAEISSLVAFLNSERALSAR